MQNTLFLTPFISQLHGKCESQYFYISSSLAALKQVSRPTGNFSSSCATCLRPRGLSGGGMADRMLTPSQPPRPDPAFPSHPCAQRSPPPPSSLPLLPLASFLFPFLGHAPVGSKKTSAFLFPFLSSFSLLPLAPPSFAASASLQLFPRHGSPQKSIAWLPQLPEPQI